MRYSGITSQTKGKIMDFPTADQWAQFIPIMASIYMWTYKFPGPQLARRRARKGA